MGARVVDAEAMPGVRVVALRTYPDARGSFCETFRQEWFPGRPAMIQANCSSSVAGVLRGLHFHRHQADYWHVPLGRMLAALADLRPGSPTHGAVATLELGEGLDRGLYIPPGVAHGYFALGALTMTYLVDRTYDPKDELGVAWDDPDLALPWPTRAPILSQRDATNPRLADLSPALLVTLDPGA